MARPRAWFEKLREDFLQVLRYRLIADKDTHLCLSLPVDMLDMQGVEDNTGRLRLCC